MAAAAKKQDAKREHLQAFVDRFKAKASKAKQAQSRVKMLEKMETRLSRLKVSVSDTVKPSFSTSWTCGSTKTTASHCSVATAKENPPFPRCYLAALKCITAKW